MNRRSFLSLLGVTAAALAMDPERLLWERGKKLISVPKVRPAFWAADWITIAGVWVRNPSNGETLTGVHQIFTVKRDTGTSHIEIYPPMIPLGIYQNVPSDNLFHGSQIPASVARHYHPSQQRFSTRMANGKYIYAS
jgi:hypothetical protein